MGTSADPQQVSFTNEGGNVATQAGQYIVHGNNIVQKSTVARTVARNYFDKKSLGACCSAKRMPPKATTSRSASIISPPHFQISDVCYFWCAAGFVKAPHRVYTLLFSRNSYIFRRVEGAWIN